MNATQRFKMRLSDAIEYTCALEENLEKMQELLLEQKSTIEEQTKLIKKYERRLKIKK